MKRFLTILGLLWLLPWTQKIVAQDFSNKGKDFWVGYGYHVRMGTGNGGSQQMVLYFATESVTNVTVSIPRLGYSVSYSNIPANSIFTSDPLPKIGTQDARLIEEGISDKGIHISSDRPIVAYAHIYDGNVSGATLLFPTNTLGKEYYSVNYKQVSNENRSNCWFYAVAVDTGTTVVQITPSANTLTRPAGQPYTVSLQQGQVINVMGELISTGIDPFTGVDLTGSTIRSIGSGTSVCKRIAVFSGSGKISLTCDNTSSSADNYIVQAFPKSAWGKRYLTTPTLNFTNNIYRVCVSDPSTVVRLNGQVLSGLVNSFYYEFSTVSPALIEADKPILVAQYISSQSACGNGITNGDPELIYLSPVEQNIDRVILNSTPNSAITQHFVNVVIKSSGVASFRVDGNAVSGFGAHPQDAGYSYAQLPVAAGSHTLQSDSGFNAIAYGYGQFESYGYNAGTNVKDLYQFISVQNQFATVSFPAACKSSPFYLSMTLPYKPARLKWLFGDALNGMGFSDINLSSPQFDSTWTVNDKQLYRYKLPTAYTLPVTGTFPIRVITQNSTEDGCSGEQEINYDLQVYERPLANFDFVNSGCVADSIYFTDRSNLAGRKAVKWLWDFGNNTISAQQNPAHLYSSAGAFPVRFSLISDIGCSSDTSAKTVTLSDPPVAEFSLTAPGCEGKAMTFINLSRNGQAGIVKWIWNFGDNSAPVAAQSAASQSHTFVNAGTYTVSLQVESAGGCRSSVFSRQVTVTANPIADFSFSTACLQEGALKFTNNSSIAGDNGTLVYAWSFGDGGTATAKDPVHTYTTSGPFTAKLIVASAAGCQDSTAKIINTIYDKPVALFSSPDETCLGNDLSFNDQSAALGSTVSSWEWNFGDGTPVVSQQHPTHRYTQSGSYVISLKVRSSNGCESKVFTKTINVLPVPVADFSVSSPACANGNVSFTNTSQALVGQISKSTWDFGDGSSSVNLPSPSHIYKQQGEFTVSLLVETNKGCKSNVISRQISIHPLPAVGFKVPGNCINDPISTFTDTSSIADGSEAQFQWRWNFGDGNASPATNMSVAQHGQHKYTATGSYTVTLAVTSKDGCSSFRTEDFTINGAVPVPQFTFSGGMKHCSNDSVSVTDNSSVTPGNLVKLEIYWDYNNNPANKLVVDNSIKGAVYKHRYPELFTSTLKTYRVKFVIYSGINCLTELDTTLTVLPVPEIQFSAVAPVCINQSNFDLQAIASNIPGTGLFTGRGVSATGTFNPSTAGTGTHIIRFSFTSANGCVSFKEQAITIMPVPTVSAGPDKVILEGGAATLDATVNGTSLTYAWTPTNSLSNPSVLQPVATPLNDINYRLTIRTAEGCTASDEVVVKVLKTPSIPNAFSPNGDGVHDRWEIQYLDSYPGAIIEIFNRYGQKVYESRGYARPWDGTVNGRALPVGTYYYIIDPKNGRKPMSGFVDLLR